MRIALGSDEATPLTAALEASLRERGHEPLPCGALAPGADDAWPSVARAVARAVASGDCAYGIVCCWTGTGVSIAANKIAGIRAALCADAQTAAGAREWNDANVLAISLRATSIPVALEILDAWFSSNPTSDERYRRMIGDVETNPTPSGSR
jgi:ribose 5-phosphate isomerase B